MPEDTIAGVPPKILRHMVRRVGPQPAQSATPILPSVQNDPIIEPVVEVPLTTFSEPVVQVIQPVESLIVEATPAPVETEPEAIADLENVKPVEVPVASRTHTPLDRIKPGPRLAKPIPLAKAMAGRGIRVMPVKPLTFIKPATLTKSATAPIAIERESPLSIDANVPEPVVAAPVEIPLEEPVPSISGQAETASSSEPETVVATWIDEVTPALPILDSIVMDGVPAEASVPESVVETPVTEFPVVSPNDESITAPVEPIEPAQPTVTEELKLVEDTESAIPEPQSVATQATSLDESKAQTPEPNVSVTEEPVVTAKAKGLAKLKASEVPKIRGLDQARIQRIRAAVATPGGEPRAEAPSPVVEHEEELVAPVSPRKARPVPVQQDETDVTSIAAMQALLEKEKRKMRGKITLIAVLFFILFVVSTGAILYFMSQRMSEERGHADDKIAKLSRQIESEKSDKTASLDVVSTKLKLSTEQNELLRKQVETAMARVQQIDAATSGKHTPAVDNQVKAQKDLISALQKKGLANEDTISTLKDELNKLRQSQSRSQSPVPPQSNLTVPKKGQTRTVQTVELTANGSTASIPWMVAIP